MKVGDIVRFQDEHFFNGAVQLGWVESQPALAQDVASAFVFHGPQYHGVTDQDKGAQESAYQLRDSASFLLNLLKAACAAHDGLDVNPFWLAIAGYGAGKSHLSVMLSTLLGDPKGETANLIIEQLSHADQEIAQQAQGLLKKLERPMLILPLDGSKRFHLGSTISKLVFSRLESAGIDAAPIRDLSPRFETAKVFVEKNFDYRKVAFATHLPDQSLESICNALNHREENVFDKVNRVYQEANGHSIAIEGQESAQDLIEILAKEYCGEDGPFSHVVLLFDELGLYLEHAAENSENAGARVLQEVFQGVQDNSSKVQFIGFIQYELTSYLQRFGGAEQRHLQRYITRFDSAEKSYLSSNLETLFAHMIHKQESALDSLWDQSQADRQLHETRQRLSLALPGFDSSASWRDESTFLRVIGRGCWPLHPFAVWLLIRQSDLIQQRSALAFVKEIVGGLEQVDVFDDDRLLQVSAADLLLDFLLDQYAAADQTPGGLIETLLTLFDQRGALLDRTKRLVMSGIAVMDKTRIAKQTQSTALTLLAEATTLPEATVGENIEDLSNLGILEWNEDLGQFELLSDGASRGQFNQWMRTQRQAIRPDEIRQLFLRRGMVDCGLQNPIETNFGRNNNILTPEWSFEATTAHTATLAQAVDQAIEAQVNARLPFDSKGKAIYLYLDRQDDLLNVERTIQEIFAIKLKQKNLEAAPVWVIGIHDTEGMIADALARKVILDEYASEGDRERFRRFIDDEKTSLDTKLIECTSQAIALRRYWIAGVNSIPQKRIIKAGEDIFFQFYPDAIPFPFDGFPTPRSAGPRDAATLARGLIAGQVNQVWIQNQSTPLRNRIFTVLRDAWQAFNSELNPCKPQDTQLGAIFESLEDAHKENPELTLLFSQQRLIAPPIGMNASSAMLLLSLLIGMRTPQRQLLLGSTPIGSADWIERALPTREKYFVAEILGQTKLRFFDEDAETRWVTLLNEWEAATRLDKVISYARQAENQRAVDPVPPTLTERLLRREASSQELSQEYHAMLNKLDTWEKNVEQAYKGSSIAYALKYGALLADAYAELSDDEKWPPKLATDCATFISYVKEVVDREVDGWINRQTVTNPTQTTSFRENMQKAASSLRKLGYETQADSLERQVQHSIYHVEELQKHALTLSQANEYPNQPEFRAGEPVTRLRAEIKRGQDLITSINRINNLAASAKQAHVDAITRKIDQIKSVVDKQLELLSDLDSLSITNEEELSEAITNVEKLRLTFSGDRNEEIVREIAVLLHHMLRDTNAWEQGEISPERLQVILRQQSSEQITNIQQFIEQTEMDPPPWDLQKLYDSLAQERIERARKRSTDWLHPRLALAQEIPALNLQRARQSFAELAAAPNYLADSERIQLEQLQDELKLRVEVLEEEEQQAKIANWQARFANLGPVTGLSRIEVERLLKELQSPPAPLTDKDEAWRDDLTNQLTKRLDELSLDDLVRRIEKLSPPLREELFNRLSAQPNVK